jgi:2-hydroxychromene-2-carboxylate isomerase
MVSKIVEFVFDFGSPNAYLAYKVLPEILRRTRAQLEILPCLLGGIFKATGNQSPIQAFANIPAKLAYEGLEMKRFYMKHGLTKFRMNPFFPVNTLLVMRGLVAVQMAGDAGRYIDAILQGLWEDKLKMDDPAVVQQVLNTAGMNGEAILARTQDADVKQKLIANTEAAVARGAFGAPTFFVGPDMFFGKERLGQVEDALMAGA